MDNLLPENEYKEFEGRAYLNPQVMVDESNTFIDNLRSSQGQQNQEIFTDTQRLGTDVPSNLGGLTGAGSYFTSRYQTPQTASNIANLRATAQASALNQVLANEEAMWKKRYNDAYRSYQKRSGSGGSGGSGGTGGTGGNSNTSNWTGDVIDVPTGLTATEVFTLDSNTAGDTDAGVKWVVNPATVGQNKLEFYRIDTTKNPGDYGYQTLYRQQDDGTLVRVGS